MAEYFSSVLGWSGNIDAALEDFFAETAASGDTLWIDGNYTTSLINVFWPDDFTMRAGLDKVHGFLRSGHGSGALFRLGNNARVYGIRGEADGWEESDDEDIWIFRADGKTNPIFTEVDIRGRGYGIQLIDCPSPEVWKSRFEGCQYMFSVQGTCDDLQAIGNEFIGGYLAPDNNQGEGIKTFRSNTYHGPQDAVILYNRFTTRRGAVDTTGGLLRGKIGFNYFAVTDDEALDFKSQYTEAEIPLVIAAGTALNKDIQTFGNTFYKCGITLTTNYGATATVSEADVDDSCVSDITFGTTLHPDTFIGDAVSNIIMVRDYASRRITVQNARTSGRISPYKYQTAGTYNPVPEDIAFNSILWDGEWQASVPLFTTNFSFSFADGSTLYDTTDNMALFTAQGNDGITLSGTVTKDASATGTITALNNTTNPATNVTDTMSIV